MYQICLLNMRFIHIWELTNLFSFVYLSLIDVSICCLVHLFDAAGMTAYT